MNPSDKDLKEILLQYNISDEDIKGHGKNGRVLKTDRMKIYKKILKTLLDESNQLSDFYPMYVYPKFNDSLSIIYNYLSPPDLLSLYLSNRTATDTLNTTQVINSLNTRFNKEYNVDSFSKWYKLYTSTVINNQLQYLYDLENIRYINDEKIQNIINGKDDIKQNMISILFDWMYTVRKMFKLHFNVYCYACTLFQILLSNKHLTKEDIQLYGCVCLLFASLCLEEYYPEDSDWIYITDGAFTIEQFNKAKIDAFKTFNGQLIYPSPIMFVDQQTSNNTDPTDNDNILVLIALTSLMTSISIYKPSLVAETCKYLITGKHNVYSIQEINLICKEIMKYLRVFIKSKLENIKPRAELVFRYIKATCGDDLQAITLNPLKYNEPWHLGDVQIDKVIGEGTYGKVSIIKRNKCGNNFAVKSIKDMDKLPEALNEISLLKLLNNQSNIINLCGYDYTLITVDIVLPLMKGTLLSSKLDKNKYDIYFRQLINGVKQCHDHDIIHRDIKLENILYDEESDSVKIIDFGLSVPFQSIKKLMDPNIVNTFHYRPPECLLFDPYQYNQSVDIWAIGCVMYYMMTDRYVMTRYDRVNAVDDIFRLLGTPNDLTWPGFTQLKKDVLYNDYPGSTNLLKTVLAPHSNLILRCLTVYPGNRPTANQLMDS
jgi:negative regulator of PHO system